MLKCLVFSALVIPCLLGQTPAPPLTDQDAQAVKIFADGVQQYMTVQKNVEASLRPLKPTNDPVRISEYEHALARKLAEARRGAKQGDIFTRQVTRYFLRVIRSEFLGPEAPLARKTIRQDDPAIVFHRLEVNDVYPENLPLTNMPPTLLSKLPPLPQNLTYRIVGHDLTLKDSKSGLIVDLIPNAIP
jgi:hypothetical protein